MRKWIVRVAGFLIVLSLVISVAGYCLLLHRTPGHSFDSAGVAIHYADQGKGTPVILVHGFAVNGDLNWRLPRVVPKLLAAGYRVITLDVRGHGLSGKPHDPAAYGSELAEDVVRLMNHLGLRTAHVAGYSLGGFVALKLAALHPERLLSVTAMGSGWADPKDSSFLDALPKLADALEAGQGITPVAAHYGGAHPTPTLAHKMEVKLLTRYFNDGAALAAMLRAGPQLGISEEQLRAIQVPVLSVIGDKDLMLPAMERMRGKVRAHTVVVVHGDHLRAIAKPELAAAMIAFYKKVDAAVEK